MIAATEQRPKVGDQVVETVDNAAGVPVEAVLTLDVVTRLGCGCWRLEAARPGGGRVNLFRGAHCETGAAADIARALRLQGRSA